MEPHTNEIEGLVIPHQTQQGMVRVFTFNLNIQGHLFSQHQLLDLKRFNEYPRSPPMEVYNS